MQFGNLNIYIVKIYYYLKNPELDTLLFCTMNKNGRRF